MAEACSPAATTQWATGAPGDRGLQQITPIPGMNRTGNGGLKPRDAQPASARQPVRAPGPGLNQALQRSCNWAMRRHRPQVAIQPGLTQLLQRLQLAAALNVVGLIAACALGAKQRPQLATIIGPIFHPDLGMVVFTGATREAGKIKGGNLL